MATTLTQAEMFGRIIDQDNRKLDIVADTRRMSATVGPVHPDGPNEINLGVDQADGVESFVLNGHAQSQVATDLSIPKRYFDRMLTDAPTLLATNVNHWLANEPKRKLIRGYRSTTTGTPNTGRAVLSDRFKRMDNIQLLRNVFPVFDEIDGLTYQASQLTDTKFYVRVLLPRLEREIKVGDTVQAGIEIRNSEVGSGQLAIDPFIFRLICLNGMTVKDASFQRRHVGRRIEDETHFSDEAVEADDRAFWLVARDTVKSLLTEVRFEEIVEQLKETVTGEKIQAPVAATETLAQRFSLTDEERDAVLANLVGAGDLSQWGMLNAVTAAAKESEDFDRQAEMEALGWDIANLNTQEWARVAVVR